MSEVVDGRDESPAERADRNYLELLQELRVLQTGVQILFGFLLIMSVQPRLYDAPAFTREVYLVVLALCCIATALLMGPAAYHRMLFGRGKAEVVRGSHVLAHGGIVALLLAISASVLLVTDLVLSRTAGWAFGCCVGLFFTTVWYLLPLVRLRRQRRT
jgi:hypothetical protein